MDLTNQKILHLLEQNSKLSLSEIGKEVNLSTPSVRERIYKLIDSKIIERYTIDINYDALGFDINVLIEVTIKITYIKISKHLFQFKTMLIFAIEFLEIVALYLKRILKDERSRNTHQRNPILWSNKNTFYIFRNKIVFYNLSILSFM